MYDCFIYTYTKHMIVWYPSSKPICTGCIAAPASVTPSQNRNKTREFFKNSRTDVTPFVRYTKWTCTASNFNILQRFGSNVLSR